MYCQDALPSSILDDDLLDPPQKAQTFSTTLTSRTPTPCLQHPRFLAAQETRGSPKRMKNGETHTPTQVLETAQAQRVGYSSNGAQNTTQHCCQLSPSQTLQQLLHPFTSPLVLLESVQIFLTTWPQMERGPRRCLWWTLPQSELLTEICHRF